MSVYGIPDSSSGLVVNSLLVERPQPPEGEASEGTLPLSDYLDSAEMLRQCCHCRRVRRPKAENTWDWVPSWVDEPPDNTSHSICEICFHTYYSDLDLPSENR